MTSTRRANSLSDVNKHPDESILLAYLRGQQFDTRSSVIQHIENEKCPVCFHKLDELKQVTHVLDVLGTMRSHQYYPELTAEDMYARIEAIAHQGISAKTANRHVKYPSRPRKSAIRLISVPAAFGLAILFTVSMMVFASLTGKPFNPFSPQGQTSSGSHILTVGISPHLAQTPRANVTATKVAPGKTTPEAKGPHMKVCSTKDNIAQMQLVVCGSGFDSAHKAILLFYVPGKQAFLSRSLAVDKYGKFHVELNIAVCGNMPTYIFGYEATSSAAIRVRLHIVSFGSCVVQTTPIVKPT